MSDASPPPALKFDNTLGALLLGGFSASILYGIMCVQCWSFFQRFTNENRWIKYAVWTLWLLDTLHLAFVIHPCYLFMVTEFGDVPKFLSGEIPWSVPAGVLTTATSAFLVQVCYTYRVWVLSRKNRLLTFPLAVMVVVFWVSGIGYAIKAFTLSTFVEYATLDWFLYMAFSFDTVSDLYIAGVLCWYLYRGRNRMARRTNSMLKVIMVYTINTGLITSFVCIACIITHATMPTNFVLFGVYFNLAGLYENSLLASLNARDWFRSAGGKSDNLVLSLVTDSSVVSRSRGGVTGNNAQGHNTMDTIATAEAGLPTFERSAEAESDFKAIVM